MGYVMRVRLASFFTGAAVASFLGLYTLHKDYKVAHQSFTQQMRIFRLLIDGVRTVQREADCCIS
ncbi:uncharacterized protein [Glycine max]|uniref:uncharacterized protein isoform X2 n=1 Tax=Glycine max TaxID=3847 RepID=UPI00023BFB1D|nr:uncharacterized protein LOC121174806 isoform X2 [Glycine max]